MQYVNVITAPNAVTNHQYNQPLRVFRKHLLENGIEVNFFDDPISPGVEDCNVLIFHEENYRDILPIKSKDRASALEFLQVFFSKFPHVIWFDDNDGSGWLRNYIFPLVDVYAKGQLLKDTGYYQENHRTGDKHRDYVYNNYSVPDSHISKGPLYYNEIQKLKVSWNMSFRNWYRTRYPIINHIINKLTRHQYLFMYTPPNLRKRGKVFQYRVSYWEKNPTVEWWRLQTKKKIQEFLIQNPSFQLTSTGRVNRFRFYRELQKSVVTISPFGIGEVCYRDFESFFTGSLLFKPSMDHLQTWPDLYIDGETYISHKWDFSDFDEKLDAILTHPEMFEEIAREGQSRFREALSNGQAFAEHFKQLIFH